MNRQYSEQYDAYYDEDTNEWLESKCDDPNCWYCVNRPENPLPKSITEDKHAKVDKTSKR